MPKRDLSFRTPFMNAAGTLGFAPEARAAVAQSLQGNWADFGAFVSNPVSMRPRTPAGEPGLLPYPGGFLLHTGLPNPGFPAVLKKCALRWADSKLPVIVHLMADRPEETGRMVQQLEEVENVAAVELGFAPGLAGDIILIALEMSLGELPLIVCLPWEQVLTVGPQAMQAGAAAISLAAPRGTLAAPLTSPHRRSLVKDESAAMAGGDGGTPRGVVSGRLYGPSLFPLALDIVLSAARLGLPVIGAGGVYSRESAGAMLAAGALAVQVNSVLWRGTWDAVQE